MRATKSNTWLTKVKWLLWELQPTLDKLLRVSKIWFILSWKMKMKWLKDVSSECPILKLSFWQSSSCQDFNLVNFCLDQETSSLISSGTSVEPSARRRRSSSWTSSPAASKKLEMTVLQSLLRRQSWWHSGWVFAFAATDPGSIPWKRLFIRKFTIRSVSLSTIVSFQVGLFSLLFFLHNWRTKFCLFSAHLPSGLLSIIETQI